MKRDSKGGSDFRGDCESQVSRLLMENRLLACQVARLGQLNQDVLHLHHRLDQERMRFEAMQRFMRQAVQAESLEMLPSLVCDATIDLLECGVGMFWCLRCAQNESCFTQSGLGHVTYDQWCEMQCWVADWLVQDRAGEEHCILDARPLPNTLKIKSDFLVEIVKDSSGQPLGLIFACNTPHQADFHDGFQFAAEKVFSTFANQVEVLIESALRRSTIIDQIERIRISEERLMTALISSNVGLWDWDISAGRVFFSEQWKSQIGMKGTEVGDSVDEWSKRLHPEDSEEVLRVVSECSLNPGGSFDLIFRMRHRRGTWIWINSRGYNMSDLDKGCQRMIGTHIDVTDHKMLEEKLQRSEQEQRFARERAERENSAKRSFLASVSHEIRTPLNGMMASFQMLERTKDLNQRERLIEMGMNSGKWMLKIIGESLDVSRIEAGAVELNPETLNLRKLLSELRDLKTGRSTMRDVEFRWEIAESMPSWVSVDGVRLRQILSNLIGNAFKFTRHGHVTVKVTAKRLIRRGRCHVRFEVLDSGRGFSAEFRKVIFEPFVQEKGRDQFGENGIGLGLVITRELVHLMGGRIYVSSRLGVGSRFVVFLPLQIAEEPSVAPIEGCLPSLPRFHGRVLIAEDDPTSGLLGKMMLERLGFSVDLAPDGGVALERVLNAEYDLIFMDCWMPVYSGLEVSTMLRSSVDAPCRNVPVIALTANARKSDERDCIAAGMNAFMTKPLLLDNLVRVVVKFLPPQTF